MRFWHDEITCSEHFPMTQRKTPFCVIGYEFNYLDQEDKQIIDKIYSQSVALANHVYDGAANNSTIHRSNRRILANCLAGMMSEFCWQHFLNYKKSTVRTTSFVSASNQIDLEILSNRKKIEVRSSFPRNGIPFAICHPSKEFDILGPYSNAYKPGEVYKDYYVRTLFHLENPFQIITKIKSSQFIVFLTGGATHQMMFDNRLSLEKTLIPEDSIDTQQPSSYRVVPFHNALDCRQIYNLITNE